MPFISAVNGSIATRQTSDFDPSVYNWVITTNIDAPNPSLSSDQSYNYVNYSINSFYREDSNYHPQWTEGTTISYTITSNAPEGTEVYVTLIKVSLDYSSSNDPNISDIDYISSDISGWKTVDSNGQFTGTVTSNDDGVAESGEMYQIWVLPRSGAYGNAERLAESQWMYLADVPATQGWDYSVKIVGSVLVSTMEADTSFLGSFTQWYGGFDFSNGSISGSTFLNSGNNVWIDFHEYVEAAVASWDGSEAYSSASYSNVSIRVTVSTNAQGYPEFLFESQNSTQDIGWSEIDSSWPDGTLAHIGFADVFTDPVTGNPRSIQVQPIANNYTIVD